MLRKSVACDLTIRQLLEIVYEPGYIIFATLCIIFSNLDQVCSSSGSRQVHPSPHRSYTASHLLSVIS